MASLMSLKRRIQAASNVSKTTRAMQMIAASKLKRAQDAALSSRPYVNRLVELAQNLTIKLDRDNLHPYMSEKYATKKTLIIVLSPDKGLCGGLVTNLTREFLRLSKNETESAYIIVGKKAETQIVRVKNEIIASFVFGTTTPTFDLVYPISHIIDEYYLNNKVDSVKILYSHFNSIFNQTPSVAALLPINLGDLQKQESPSNSYIFEPDLSTLLPPLLKHYLEMTIYQYMLESFVSEQAARMIAMQNATTNAKEIIEDLRLEYNKTRQSKITNEILDITNTGITITK